MYDIICDGEVIDTAKDLETAIALMLEYRIAFKSKNIIYRSK